MVNSTVPDPISRLYSAPLSSGPVSPVVKNPPLDISRCSFIDKEPFDTEETNDLGTILCRSSPLPDFIDLPVENRYRLTLNLDPWTVIRRECVFHPDRGSLECIIGRLPTPPISNSSTLLENGPGRGVQAVGYRPRSRTKTTPLITAMRRYFHGGYVICARGNIDKTLIEADVPVQSFHIASTYAIFKFADLTITLESELVCPLVGMQMPIWCLAQLCFVSYMDILAAMGCFASPRIPMIHRAHGLRGYAPRWSYGTESCVVVLDGEYAERCMCIPPPFPCMMDRQHHHPIHYSIPSMGFPLRRSDFGDYH